MKFNLDSILAWVLGIGVVLFAFRTTAFNGILVGLVICLLVVFFLLRQSKYWTKETLGSKFVYIPLAVISASIIISGIYQYTINGVMDTLITRIAVGFLFFGVYLSARILGEKIFKPFAIAVVVEAVSVIVFSLLNSGFHNGGFSSYVDYNLGVALLLVGATVSIFYKQWIVLIIALIGLVFTGAEEAVIGIGVLFLAILIRRDFSKKFLVFIGVVFLIGILGIEPFSYTLRFFANPIDKASVLITGKHNERVLSIIEQQNRDLLVPSVYDNSLDYALHGRLDVLKKALNEWQWWGSGYTLNPVDNVDNPIYNVPLVIAQQVSVIGALAWLFLIIYCLIKTNWKYAFVAVIGMCLFDDILWCELGVWVYCLAGVSTVSERKSDLIFKGVE